jgi:adenylate cyclase
MVAIPKFWQAWAKPHEAVSRQFEHMLMREVMRTELVRVRALITVALCIMVIVFVVHTFFPNIVHEVWRGINPNAIYRVLIIFTLFELWVHTAISGHLKNDDDMNVYRRYLGAFIEISVPSYLLFLQIEAMGPVRALGFVMPMVYFIFIILSTLRLDFWLSAFTGLVAAVQLFALAMYFKPEAGSADPEPEIYYHLSRSLVLFACGVLAGGVGSQLRRGFAASIRAATARDRITNLFGQHVSPQVVERLLLEGTATQSDIRQVAVMFVDFRSFTAGARSRSPQDVVDRLDGAFAVLVEILDRHGGIVNKFLGDGFLALFGAPFQAEDPAHRAVAAAREMLAAMHRINEDSSWPLRIGVGVHFGEVVAGNIGSPRRKEYTVIGDTVNFASRLEALNKDFNSQLLISSAVRDVLGKDGSDAVALGEVPVRGYEQPMEIWQLG